MAGIEQGTSDGTPPAMEDLWKTWDSMEERVLNAIQMHEQIEGHYELAAMNVRLMNQLIALLIESDDQAEGDGSRSALLDRAMAQMERAKAVVFREEDIRSRDLLGRRGSAAEEVLGTTPSSQDERDASSADKEDEFIAKMSFEKEWDRKEVRDVIADVIDSNCLPIGQVWLRSHGKRRRTDWSAVKNLVIKSHVMSKLRSGHLDQAIDAIKQLGLDCMQILLQIFESTNEPQVRNLVATEVKKQGLLNQHHEVNLMVINLIERLYSSCPNELYHLSVDCVSKLKLAEMQLILAKGIFYPLSPLSSSRHSLQEHSHSEEILSEAQILEELRNLVTCESLWRYLIDRTDIKRIENWMSNFHQIQDSAVSTSFPFNSEISESMLNYCQEFGNELVKEALYDWSVINGKWQIFSNFNQILKRLIRTRQSPNGNGNNLLLSLDSSLAFNRLLNQNSASLNGQLLTYLIENRLFELIYFYADKFSPSDMEHASAKTSGSPLSIIMKVIASGKACESLASQVKMPTSPTTEISETISSSTTSEKPAEAHAQHEDFARSSQIKLNENIFELIINSARLVCDQVLIDNDALRDHLIAADLLNVVLIAHEYAMNPREFITLKLLERLRIHHPVLHRGAVSVLQSRTESQVRQSQIDPKHLCYYHVGDNNLQPCFDSKFIYDLLDGSVPVNIARIFAWQSRNLVKAQHAGEHFDLASDSGISAMGSKDHSQASEDFLKEMPYFSHPKLASKYGLGVNFTYIYFLTHQRPLEAYLAYLHERKMSPSTAQIIESIAFKKAALVAYTNLKDPRVSASCVIFQELVRGDSSELRLHLAVASFILKHAAVFLDYAERDRETTLGYHLRRAHDKNDKQAATKLLQILAMGFEKKYNREDVVTVEELIEWRLPLTFASFHGLDLPTEFLEKSAKNDHWLHYALFLQMNDISKDVAIKCLRHFNNACIAEHLEKAFNTSVITDKGPGPNDSKALMRRGRKIIRSNSKDMRIRIYNRIGVVSPPSRLPRGAADPMSSSPMTTSLPNPNLSTPNFRSPNALSSEGEGDSMSIFSDGDTTFAETISVMSISEHSDPMEGCKFDITTAPKDLFGVLLRAATSSNSDYIWKPLLSASVSLSNPALALMAVSLNEFPSASIVMNGFCCWLLASVDPNIKNDFLSKKGKPSDLPYTWTAEGSLNLIEFILTKRRHFRLLQLGLDTFTSSSLPISRLLNFLTDFLIEKNYFNWNDSSMKQIVDAFDRFEDDHFWTEATIPWSLFTKNWNLLIANICIRNALMLSLNQFEQIVLIHLLLSFDGTLLADDYLKWKTLHRMLICVKDTEINVDVKDLIVSKITTQEDEKRFKEWVIGVGKVLQEKLYFDEARKFASAAGIPLHVLIVNEWTLKANHDRERIEFWQECWNDFLKHNVPYKDAIKLYLDLSEQVESVMIKCFLLSKCFIHGTQELVWKTEDIEGRFWLAAVEAENMLYIQYPSPSHHNSSYEAWDDILSEVISHVKSNGYPNLSKDEAKSKIVYDSPRALESLIEKLIKNACLETSVRVCELFSHACQDLEIVQVCHNVAQGLITCKDDIPMQIMYQLDNCDFITSTGGTIFNGKEILQLISKLTFLTTIGRPACNRILTHYKISLLLGCDYLSIANRHDDVSIVKDLMKLALTSPDAVLLIKDLVQLSSMPDEVVAQIICDDFVVQRCLINSRLMEGPTNFNSMSSSPSVHQGLPGEPKNTGSQVAFYSLMRLLSDSSALGNKLLMKMSEVIELDETVELLIKSHECFSMTCDLEGISLVLQKTRQFIYGRLAPEKNYALMQRLLMGIGRYSEMTYVFDIFRDDHVFERLLGKFTDKVPQLRIALLNYLKSDSEMKKLVALNFSMHREIADDHQQSAKRQLKRIDALFKKYPNLQQNHEIIRELETILQNQIDSAISYSKAGCFVSANQCERQAQLISLQIHLIQTQANAIVLNMDESQVAKFISNHPKFHEAYIVAEAYDHHRSWSSALYNNVVANDDGIYLRNFISLIELSMDLVEGVANLYAQAVTKAPLKEAHLKKGMQKILKFEKNIRFKLKIALKLRFADVVNELIESESGTILKDLTRNSLI